MKHKTALFSTKTLKGHKWCSSKKKSVVSFSIRRLQYYNVFAEKRFVARYSNTNEVTNTFLEYALRHTHSHGRILEIIKVI